MDVRSRLSFLAAAVLALFGLLYVHRVHPPEAGLLLLGLPGTTNMSAADKSHPWKIKGAQTSVPVMDSRRDEGSDRTKLASLEALGVLFTINSSGWHSLTCDQSRKLKRVSVKTGLGTLRFYVYDSKMQDRSVTARALGGSLFERAEIDRFLRLSSGLPLIDIGANVGVVALQAAMQGRQVIAVEPVPENALRLCRAVLDFGHSSLVHVVQNAVSSLEGNVTVAMDTPAMMTHYEMRRWDGWGHDSLVAWSMRLDRLLDVVPFKTAALKIDVESHEGHVLAGAKRLFQELNVPIVWMEWGHVKGKRLYGGSFIIQFMVRHGMRPYNLISGQFLHRGHFKRWPFSVLWRKTTPPSA